MLENIITAENFTNQHSLWRVGIRDRSQGLGQLEGLWLVQVIFPFLKETRFIVIRDIVKRRWVIAQLLIFEDGMKDVQTETVYAFVEPMPSHAQHGFPDFRVAIVEIGLERQKVGIIILVRNVIVMPTGAAGQRLPIIGWMFPIPSVPDIPIPFGVIPAAARLLEPGVIAGSVVHHQIKEDTHVSLMNFLDQILNIIEIAVFRGDIKEIADIVAPILLRAAEKGG